MSAIVTFELYGTLKGLSSKLSCQNNFFLLTFQLLLHSTQGRWKPLNIGCADKYKNPTFWDQNLIFT